MKKNIFILFFTILTVFIYSTSAPSSDCAIDLIIFDNKIYCPTYRIDTNKLHFLYVYCTDDNSGNSGACIFRVSYMSLITKTIIHLFFN